MAQQENPITHWVSTQFSTGADSDASDIEDPITSTTPTGPFHNKPDGTAEFVETNEHLFKRWSKYREEYLNLLKESDYLILRHYEEQQAGGTTTLDATEFSQILTNRAIWRQKLEDYKIDVHSAPTD